MGRRKYPNRKRKNEGEACPTFVGIKFILENGLERVKGLFQKFWLTCYKMQET